MKIQFNEIAYLYKKDKSRSYLLGFLKGDDTAKQREIVYSTFQVYYNDETNPFQILMPKVAFRGLTGVYPDAVEDEVRYLVMRQEERKEIERLKEIKADLRDYICSTQFREKIDNRVEKVLQDLFIDKDKLYYTVVTTDDFEYQRELRKMMEADNSISIGNKKLKIVLAEFESA